MTSLRQLADTKQRMAAQEAKTSAKRLVSCFRDAATFVRVPSDIPESALVEALSRMIEDPATFTAAGERRIADFVAIVAAEAGKATRGKITATPDHVSDVVPPSSEGPRPRIFPTPAASSASEPGRRPLVPGRAFPAPDPLSNG